MRRFTTDECEDFLRRIDSELEGSCSIVLVGGGAVALKYKGAHATTDLDLWSVSEAATNVTRRGFWAAVELAKSKQAEPIPIQKATIAQPPYSFEDRLIVLSIRGLSKLAVLVPEAHDLVMMKLARGEAHDLDAIDDIHRAAPLDLEVLVARYEETKSQVLGSQEMHRLNFLAVVARVFGEAHAEAVDTRTS